MLEARMTARELRQGRVFYCGYCQIEAAVRWLPRIGYTCGVYGWNSSVYACGDLVLVTGYRPAGRWELTLEECRKLNEAANTARSDQKWEDMTGATGLAPEGNAVVAALREIHASRRSAIR